MRWLLLALLLSPCLSLADPKSHYMLHCMGCHLKDGRGLPPEVPVFSGELGHIVSTQEGRAYLAQVPGAAQAPLNDADLAALLNYLLTKYSASTLPESFSPYDAREVSIYRRESLLNPVESRARLLGQK